MTYRIPFLSKSLAKPYKNTGSTKYRYTVNSFAYYTATLLQSYTAT